MFATIIPESWKNGYYVSRNAYFDWAYSKQFKRPRAALPKEADQYLTWDNSTLVDLQRRYADRPVFSHTFWKEWRKHIDLKRFRGEGHYLTQQRRKNVGAQYLATTAVIEVTDDWHLLEGLREDGLFGCHTYRFGNNRLVSRDLLDSILELRFLRKALSAGRNDRLRAFAIGAGYGRFAHHFLATFPQGSITNADGIAESTFLCEF